MKYLRETKAKDGRVLLYTLHEDEREYPRTPDDGNCCSLHWVPPGDHCDDYTPDTGPGILMKACSNCWYFNDRQLKYERIEK